MTQMTDFSYNVYTVGHVLYVYTLYITIRQECILQSTQGPNMYIKTPTHSYKKMTFCHFLANFYVVF